MGSDASKKGRMVFGSAVICAIFVADPASAQWPQWGGPNRNFKVDVTGLADEWPTDGPPKLWHRALGEGYAPISVDDGLIFTMYRKSETDETEYTIAIDAKTGKTVWERGARSLITKDMAQWGPGPHSAALIVGDRLFTVGANLALQCFEKKTGSVIWRHDLLKERDLAIPVYGFAASPLAYKNMIILPVGGSGKENRQIVAFDQADGHVVWESAFDNKKTDLSTYTSPVIIRFDGEDQLVALTNEKLEARNPDTGKLLWDHPVPAGRGVTVSTPVFNGKDLLFCSAAYESGSRALRLTRKDGITVPQELWFSRRLRIHHGDAMLIGDHIYASSGDFGTAFFMAMNINTGKRVWVHRGLAKANTVYADGKLIILDEEGQLLLATVTPEKLTIHSQCKISDQRCWTAPTLVEKTLYVRDRKYIMALDLGLDRS